MDKIDSNEAVIFGCLVGIISSATQSVGLTLQRKSHLMEDSRPSSLPKRPAHRRGLWQAGVLLFIASNLFGSSVQITTLPLIVLSPLQAIGLVFNSIAASILLQEPFTRFSLIGTGLVSLGALIIAAFGAISEPHHNLNELLVLFERPQFLIWMGFTLCLVVLILTLLSTGVVDNLLNDLEIIGGGKMLYGGYSKNGYSITGSISGSGTTNTGTTSNASNTGNTPVTTPIKGTASYTPTTPYGPYTPTTPSTPISSSFPSYHLFLANKSLIVGGLYGVVSGILSAHSLLMAKSAVELLVRGFKDGWHDFFRWQAWIIVCFFIIFAVSQLYYLNHGLTLCSTSVLYPLVFCIYNITTILNGLIYFRQTSSLSFNRILLVAFGTLLVLIGVLCLSWRLHDNQSINSNNNNSITSTTTTPRRPTAATASSHHRTRSNTGTIYEEHPTQVSESEHTPLLLYQHHLQPPRKYNALEGLITDEEHPEYTSFRSMSIGGGGIPEPGSPYSNRRSNLRRGRTLSQEQSEIFDQLRQK